MEDKQFQTRYPNYNVLDKWSSPDWDDQTREVVRKRLEEVPLIRFFTNEEAHTLSAVAERIVPQPDRNEAEKVPIVPWIDEKLFEDKRDGYRYEEMPPQRDAWRLGLAGIKQTAQVLFAGHSFIDLDPLSQDVVLRHIARGDAADGVWKKMPAARFFKEVLVALSLRFTMRTHSLGTRSGTAGHRRRVATYVSGKAASILGKLLKLKPNDYTR